MASIPNHEEIETGAAFGTDVPAHFSRPRPRPVSARPSRRGGWHVPAVLVPLIGQVKAGQPALANQLSEEYFVLPKRLVGEGALFLLRVKGDSMIDAAIADGDLAVVREQSVAENGEIVVAMIDGEATIKRYRISGSEVWLIPENQGYQPIRGQQVDILGKVVAIMRRL